MDADLWLKFLLKYGTKSVVQLPEVVVNFREHEDSKTVNNRDSMVVERAVLLGRTYQSENLPNEEIKAGIQDFLMFWLKKFHAEKNENAKKSISLIDPKKLSLKDKLYRQLIKFQVG